MNNIYSKFKSLLSKFNIITLKIIVLFFFSIIFTQKVTAQIDTCTNTLTNIQLLEGGTKLSFDIYSLRTYGTWRMGSSAYIIKHTSGALSNPIITYMNPKFTSGSPSGSYNNAQISSVTSTRIALQILYSGGLGDSVSNIPGTTGYGEKIATIQTDYNADSTILIWDLINSVIVTNSGGNVYSKWNFSIAPPPYNYFKINLKIFPEGLYFPIFNQLSRTDTIKVYLRNSLSPYNMLDSAKGSIHSVGLSGIFTFNNAPSGNYYIVVKHFNSIETWSKFNGENFVRDGSTYNYDFSVSSSQAYGNNLALKGTQYCLFSGDINQDGFVNLSDVIPINNDASSFVTGTYLVTDLTGNNIVDLTDVSLCYNNSSNFVRVKRP